MELHILKSRFVTSCWSTTTSTSYQYLAAGRATTPTSLRVHFPLTSTMQFTSNFQSTRVPWVDCTRRRERECKQCPGSTGTRAPGYV
eukprot:472285-Rhodomonas_salina.4